MCPAQSSRRDNMLRHLNTMHPGCNRTELIEQIASTSSENQSQSSQKSPSDESSDEESNVERLFRLRRSRAERRRTERPHTDRRRSRSNLRESTSNLSSNSARNSSPTLADNTPTSNVYAQDDNQPSTSYQYVEPTISNHQPHAGISEPMDLSTPGQITDPIWKGTVIRFVPKIIAGTERRNSQNTNEIPDDAEHIVPVVDEPEQHIDSNDSISEEISNDTSVFKSLEQSDPLNYVTISSSPSEPENPSSSVPDLETVERPASTPHENHGPSAVPMDIQESSEANADSPPSEYGNGAYVIPTRSDLTVTLMTHPDQITSSTHTIPLELTLQNIHSLSDSFSPNRLSQTSPQYRPPIERPAPYPAHRRALSFASERRRERRSSSDNEALGIELPCFLPPRNLPEGTTVSLVPPRRRSFSRPRLNLNLANSCRISSSTVDNQALRSTVRNVLLERREDPQLVPSGLDQPSRRRSVNLQRDEPQPGPSGLQQRVEEISSSQNITSNNEAEVIDREEPQPGPSGLQQNVQEANSIHSTQQSPEPTTSPIEIIPSDYTVPLSRENDFQPESTDAEINYYRSVLFGERARKARMNPLQPLFEEQSENFDSQQFQENGLIPEKILSALEPLATSSLYQFNNVDDADTESETETKQSSYQDTSTNDEDDAETESETETTVQFAYRRKRDPPPPPPSSNSQNPPSGGMNSSTTVQSQSQSSETTSMSKDERKGTSDGLESANTNQSQTTLHINNPTCCHKIHQEIQQPYPPQDFQQENAFTLPSPQEYIYHFSHSLNGTNPPTVPSGREKLIHTMPTHAMPIQMTVAKALSDCDDMKSEKSPSKRKCYTSLMEFIADLSPPTRNPLNQKIIKNTRVSRTNQVASRPHLNLNKMQPDKKSASRVPTTKEAISRLMVHEAILQNAQALQEPQITYQSVPYQANHLYSPPTIQQPVYNHSVNRDDETQHSIAISNLHPFDGAIHSDHNQTLIATSNLTPFEVYAEIQPNVYNIFHNLYPSFENYEANRQEQSQQFVHNFNQSPSFSLHSERSQQNGNQICSQQVYSNELSYSNDYYVEQNQQMQQHEQLQRRHDEQYDLQNNTIKVSVLVHNHMDDNVPVGNNVENLVSHSPSYTQETRNLEYKQIVNNTQSISDYDTIAISEQDNRFEQESKGLQQTPVIVVHPENIEFIDSNRVAPTTDSIQDNKSPPEKSMRPPPNTPIEMENINYSQDYQSKQPKRYTKNRPNRKHPIFVESQYSDLQFSEIKNHVFKNDNTHVHQEHSTVTSQAKQNNNLTSISKSSEKTLAVSSQVQKNNSHATKTRPKRYNKKVKNTSKTTTQPPLSGANH